MVMRPEQKMFAFSFSPDRQYLFTDYLPVKQRNMKSAKEGSLQSEIYKKESIHLVARIKKYTLSD